MSLQKGLGKGLGSLIPNKRNDEKSSSVTSFGLPINGSDTKDNGTKSSMHSVTAHSSTAPTMQKMGNGKDMLRISIDTITANPYQPREQFEHQQLEELIDSIKRYGILQPLVVVHKNDGTYELIAGERRLRAAEIAGLHEVPVVVRDAVDNEVLLELAVIENVQRADLNPMEEARAYQRLRDEFNLTQEEVAKRVGKSRAKIANIMRLLTLPSEIQDGLKSGKITEGHGKILAGLTSEKEQLRVYRQITMHGLSVSETVYHTGRRAPSFGIRKQSGERNPELHSDAKAVQNVLGTKVSFQDIGGKGKMIIEYYSEEERKSIVEKITGNIR